MAPAQRLCLHRASSGAESPRHLQNVLRNFTTGKAHSFGGEYVELVQNERLRYTDKFESQPTWRHSGDDDVEESSWRFMSVVTTRYGEEWRRCDGESAARRTRNYSQDIRGVYDSLKTTLLHILTTALTIGERKSSNSVSYPAYFLGKLQKAKIPAMLRLRHIGLYTALSTVSVD
jgi:uncharacterized protein YndB with AHSA1/START domain